MSGFTSPSPHLRDTPHIFSCNGGGGERDLKELEDYISTAPLPLPSGWPWEDRPPRSRLLSRSEIGLDFTTASKKQADASPGIEI